MITNSTSSNIIRIILELIIHPNIIPTQIRYGWRWYLPRLCCYWCFPYLCIKHTIIGIPDLLNHGCRVSIAPQKVKANRTSNCIGGIIVDDYCPCRLICIKEYGIRIGTRDIARFIPNLIIYGSCAITVIRECHRCCCQRCCPLTICPWQYILSPPYL